MKQLKFPFFLIGLKQSENSLKGAAAWIFRLKFIYNARSYQFWFFLKLVKEYCTWMKKCWRQNISVIKIKTFILQALRGMSVIAVRWVMSLTDSSTTSAQGWCTDNSPVDEAVFLPQSLVWEHCALTRGSIAKHFSILNPVFLKEEFWGLFLFLIKTLHLVKG